MCEVKEKSIWKHRLSGIEVIVISVLSDVYPNDNSLYVTITTNGNEFNVVSINKFTYNYVDITDEKHLVKHSTSIYITALSRLDYLNLIENLNTLTYRRAIPFKIEEHVIGEEIFPVNISNCLGFWENGFIVLGSNDEGKIIIEVKLNGYLFNLPSNDSSLIDGNYDYDVAISVDEDGNVHSYLKSVLKSQTPLDFESSYIH